MYYIGVDIGGTNIKSGVVSESGEVISEYDIPTGADRPQEIVLQDILSSVKNAVECANLKLSDIKAVGVGSPGDIDNKNGIVIYNNNLGWRNFHIAELMSKELNLNVHLENDADAATLGEVISGSARGASSAMIVTLGTGVGTGFVINGKIWPGCEFGHMVINCDGKLCTCGRRGCFEAYSSATGLINMTREAINLNPESILTKIADREKNITGKTKLSLDSFDW